MMKRKRLAQNGGGNQKRHGFVEGQDVMFKPAAIDLLLPPAIIFAGLYPPAKSSLDSQYDNRTSRDVIIAIGNKRFNWVDLCLRSPARLSGDMVLNDIKEACAANSAIGDYWMQRVSALYAKDTRAPLYICGDICQSEFDAWCKRHQVSIEVLSSLYDVVRVTRPGEPPMVVAMNRPHPSAHLMAGGKSEARHTFYETMRLIDALAHLGADAITISNESINERVGQAMSVDAAAENEFQEKLGLPQGRWPAKWKHLRNYRWSQNPFASSVDSLIRLLGVKIGLQLLASSGFALRITNPVFMAALLSFIERVGQANAIHLFSGNSFCTRCESESFVASLARFAELVGKANAIHLFRSNSFCKRCESESFVASLASFTELVGQANAIRLFGGNSFCTRCESESFVASILRFTELVGQSSAIHLFSHGSFCTRCESESFVASLASFIELDGQANAICLFRSNSFCKRCEDPEFLARLFEISKFVEPNKIASIFNKDAICSRLCDDTFFAIVTQMTSFNLPKKCVASILGNAALNADVLQVFVSALHLCPLKEDRVYVCKLFVGDYYKTRMYRDAGVRARLLTLLAVYHQTKFDTVPGTRPTYNEIKGDYVPLAMKSRKNE